RHLPCCHKHQVCPADHLRGHWPGSAPDNGVVVEEVAHVEGTVGNRNDVRGEIVDGAEGTPSASRVEALILRNPRAPTSLVIGAGKGSKCIDFAEDFIGGKAYREPVPRREDAGALERKNRR